MVKGAEFFLSGELAAWWQIIVGGLFIFVVLVMRDGIVGTIGNWCESGEGATIEEVTRCGQGRTTGSSIGSRAARRRQTSRCAERTEGAGASRA